MLFSHTLYAYAVGSPEIRAWSSESSSSTYQLIWLHSYFVYGLLQFWYLCQAFGTVRVSLLPSIGREGVRVEADLWSPAVEKSVHQHVLPLSGNYVFYLGGTYRYFNIGYPAILMAHYSNKWGENTVGLVTPCVRLGPPSRHTCWDKVTFITDTFAGQKQNGRWGQR